MTGVLTIVIGILAVLLSIFVLGYTIGVHDAQGLCW